MKVQLVLIFGWLFFLFCGQTVAMQRASRTQAEGRKNDQGLAAMFALISAYVKPEVVRTAEPPPMVATLNRRQGTLSVRYPDQEPNEAQTIPTGPWAFLNGMVYVTSRECDALIVFDPVRNQVVHFIPSLSLTDRQYMAPMPPIFFKGRVYISFQMSDVVVVIDPQKNYQVIDRILLSRRGAKFGSGPLQPVPVGDVLYVTQQFDRRISVIDPEQRHRVIRTIEVGDWPDLPYWQGQTIRVNNTRSRTLTVIDPSTHDVIRTQQTCAPGPCQSPHSALDSPK
jgi:hypothetical protein